MNSEDKPSLPLVSLYKEGNYARLQVKYLGGELFQVYRKAIEGAQYVRDRGANLASFDKVPVILNRLKEMGFDSWVDPSLKRVLQERTALQWMDLKAAQDRIETIDEEMYRLTLEKNGKGDRLYPFQRTGAQWLTLKYGALLADEQGTGKTLQTIAAIPANVPTLVICPSMAKGVWQREVAKFRPNIKVTILRGRDSFRWPTNGEMIVVNYDILPKAHDETGAGGRKCDGFLPPKLNPCKGCVEKDVFQAHLQSQNPKSKARKGHLEGCEAFLKQELCPGCHPFLNRVPPNMVLVCDEAHFLKTAGATRTKRARAISEVVRAQGGRTWLLTGTPLENEPSELWSVFQAAGIAQEAFGDWKRFLALFKGKSLPFGGYSWGLPDDNDSARDVRERLRRVSLRRMRAEVLPELPSKRWQQIEVDVDRKSLAECERYVKQVGGIDKVTELLELEKIDFKTISSVRSALATAKIPAMLEFVKDFDEKKIPLLVFSAHRAPIDALARRPGWEIITGDIDAAKKTEIEARFQRGELKGLGLTIRSGGMALTLTNAYHVMFVDLDWKPTANEQAEDRACRLGQTNGVVITILMANHMLDKRITEVLHKKRKLITASVDAARITDDAPPDAELEAYVHKIQEEIAGGGAVRRMAETSEQKEALEALHKLVFDNRGDERLAMSLAEEATTIGLSEKQWDLAGRIVSRGKPREIMKELEVVLNGAHVVKKAAKMNDSSGSKGKKNMPRVEKKSEANGKNDEPSPKIARVLLLVRSMSDEEREELFDRMGCEFCLMCGEEIPEDGGMDEHMKTCSYNEDDDDDEDEEIPEDDSDLLEAKEKS